ncbi:Hok/Gef family protein [Enterobacter wuhouensis]
MHGTESGKPQPEFKSGRGRKRHVQPWSSLPRPLYSKEASMKRQNPGTGVLMIIALTIIILTLVTRKTLCEISFRNDSFAVTARMDCRSGK